MVLRLRCSLSGCLVKYPITEGGAAVFTLMNQRGVCKLISVMRCLRGSLRNHKFCISEISTLLVDS